MHVGRSVANSKVVCQFCSRETNRANLRRHEEKCKSNPVNQKECPVCKKMFAGGKTCSYACSNTFFRSGPDNPNWKDESYRTTCFHYHEKKCLVCGECKIVEVHHVDENKANNLPENLVPLCPTHHQYVHSQYRDEVQPLVDAYIKEFLGI